jgi:hypothetical protein
MAFIKENKDQDNVLATNTESVNSLNTQAPQAKKGSGLFTNVNKFVDANKPAVGKLAGKLESDITKTADKVKTGLQTTQQQFQSNIQPEKSRLEQGDAFINQSLQQAQQGQRLDQDNLNKFQQYRTGEGTQFNTSENLGDLANQANQAEQLGVMTTSESGRKQLLSKFLNQPTYTAGQKRLDQMLLQSTPNVVRDLSKSAINATGQLNESIAGELANQNTNIQDINAKRNALQQLAQSQVQSNQSSFENELQGNLQSRQEAIDNALASGQTNLAQALKNTNYQEASKIIKELTGQDVDVSQFKGRDDFTQGLLSYWKNQFLGSQSGDIEEIINQQNKSISGALSGGERLTLETAVTPEERARYQALADLSNMGMSERMLAETGNQALTPGQFNSGAMGQYNDSIKAIQDRVLGNLASTKTNYQAADIEAIPVMKQLLETGAAPSYYNSFGVHKGYDVARIQSDFGLSPAAAQGVVDRLNAGQSPTDIMTAYNELQNLNK